MKRQYIDNLIKMKLFSCFEKQELYTLLDDSEYSVKNYAKGQVAHLQNEKCKSMDVILSGSVYVQKIEENGNILKVAHLQSGDVIGINLIFASKSNYPMTIIAETDSTVLQIPKDLVSTLIQANVLFMQEILRIISDKTQIMTDKIHAVTLRTIRQKLVDFITTQVYNQNSLIIKMPISKKDLAETLGVARTSISREMNKMREEGIINYHSRIIEINEKLLKLNKLF